MIKEHFVSTHVHIALLHENGKWSVVEQHSSSIIKIFSFGNAELARKEYKKRKKLY
jgi:hypothetical protein